MGYLELQYSLERQLKSDYPDQLVAYLYHRLRLNLGWSSLGGRKARIVDFGCGRGDFTLAWGRLIPSEVCGVDRESGHLQADFDQPAILLDLAEIDLVFSKSLIEHLWDPTRMLQEARRILKPGGRLVILCPDWRSYMRTFYDDYTHVRPYDQVSLGDVLRANGFSEVSCSRIYQYPPIWRWPALGVVATLWRWLIPIEVSLWLSRKTGISFFRWASQLTLLAAATK
jgi:SAM-dependent methyltransferase